MKNVLDIIKWLAALAVVFGLAFAAYAFVKIYRPRQTAGMEKVFVVPQGASAKKVARSLADGGLISRPVFFEIYVYLSGAAGRIQAGSYAITPAMSIARIADMMAAGEVRFDGARITVIEGWSAADIGEALEKTGITTKADFLRANATLEGYLFPDTYLIGASESAAAIGEKMKKNFDRKAGSVTRDELILASIVEREVGRNVERGTSITEDDLEKLQEERRLVAGVFQNRLALGMALQSDATIGYITGSRSNRATLEETRLNSPYNTYRHTGLPPGPIGNPGLPAIRAAQNPADTDFLYFLSGADGTAYFAKTLEEHNRNKEKYLK